MSVPNQDLRLGMVLIHLLLQPSSSFTQDRQQIFASLPVLVRFDWGAVCVPV